MGGCKLRKTVIIVIVIMILIITGCSNKKVVNHNYTYKGENEFWIAEYRVNGTGTFTEENGMTIYKSNCDKILTINYKKNLSDLSSVKHLEISCESSAGNKKLIDNFDNNHPIKKTYTLKSSGSGIAIENKKEIIKVNIDLGEKTETIELKNVQ